ncbi:serine/threonine-protein kinase [Streptomyces mirabilis]|nr:serine/threonine-protein kinase [Streptomyces mirabilis]
MGEVFAGRYELVDPIGHGGVGAVWRAWDQRRRRYVAAKVLQQSDAHALLRFVREQALRIDHPHVLAPASWAADDDKVLFTMDLVAGGSLVHLVNDYGPLPPAFVCTLLDQLLSGVAAVHAEGVVHRDIKPANILLEATGTARPRLRLSDFGIAMRLGEPRLTETNYVVGTPGYFAPEQMMGAEPDFPADLFAVGLVALYLLEGARPDAKALIEYFAENGTPAAPQGIPEPLWQVVATLLQPDPRARFRTATGARKALASAAELLPEPGPDDELVEVFDQLGPLPRGSARRARSGRPRQAPRRTRLRGPAPPPTPAPGPSPQPAPAPLLTRLPALPPAPAPVPAPTTRGRGVTIPGPCPGSPSPGRRGRIVPPGRMACVRLGRRTTRGRPGAVRHESAPGAAAPHPPRRRATAARPERRTTAPRSRRHTPAAVRDVGHRQLPPAATAATAPVLVAARSAPHSPHLGRAAGADPHPRPAVRPHARAAALPVWPADPTAATRQHARPRPDRPRRWPSRCCSSRWPVSRWASGR